MISLVQAGLFLLIAISYVFVLTRLVALFGFISGLIFELVGRLSGFEGNTVQQKYLALIESVSNVVFSSGVLLFIYLFDIWASPFLRLWSNPLLITWVFITATIQMTFIEGPHPVLRTSAKSTFILIWPTTVLITIGSLSPSLIEMNTFRWGVTTSAIFTIIAGTWTSVGLPSRIRRIESLRQRLESLEDDFENIGKFRNIVGSNLAQERIDAAIATINSSYERARDELSRGNLDEAEAQIIQIEQNINEIKNIFQNEVRLSLSDELETRLSQLQNEADDLIDEAETSEIELQHLAHLKEEIDEIRLTVDELDFEESATEDLVDLIEQFDALFGEINDIRSALRFRRNIDSTLDKFYREVNKKNRTVEIANHLGINVENQIESLDDLRMMLQEFQSVSVESSDELVRNFQSIQAAMTNFRNDVERISSRIEEGWQQKTIESGQITLYVPRYCYTYTTIRGAIVIQFDSGRNYISPSIEGTLIELPKNKKIEVAPDDEFGIEHFTIAGKQGRTGTLTFRFEELESKPLSFRVRIIPSLSELFEESLKFATPIGAFVAAATWLLSDFSFQKIGAIVFVVGGLSVILIFPINYIRRRQEPLSSFRKIIRRLMLTLRSVV